ncbi:DNA replication/repair protein RecF [Jatrophihabitans telluris]|uniref:DNA replication and repair protein RecF n=1 Tax=Jatrophihabitans telluris TaxID=2038343 RepID=A0ABY4QZM1_9ACTN|nr:DNA replication/repair protein RecF [Jatrophihabitans telluris]UQX88557.1 DNA replication/repair protein RecF [Jatrophihabitans telluris]
MYVQHLSVADFRSWPRADLAFDPGVSVLVGANGQGKTNLLEALGYLSTLGSHRVSTDAPLIRSGADTAVVQAAVVNDGRQLVLEVAITAGRANKAKLNRSPVTRPRDILGGLRTVLFAPEDLAVVRGDPSERRRFLDEVLVQRTPRLAGVRADYDRVLKQRAALLKTAGAARRAGGAGDLRTLDVWDGHLAEHGAQLLAARLDLVRALRPYAEEAYTRIAPENRASPPLRSPFGLRYVSSIDSALPSGSGPEVGNGDLESEIPTIGVLTAALLAELARVRASEIERGVSLVGPHRDELELSLNGLPIRGYASHGEGWSAALALRLACFDLLGSDGAEPVLILDDVFAELDRTRRQALAALAGKAEQVLISAAVVDDVPEELSGARFDIADGEVRRVV